VLEGMTILEMEDELARDEEDGDDQNDEESNEKHLLSEKIEEIPIELTRDSLK
jgi:hypothetical protein